MSWLISSTSPGFVGSAKTQTKERKPTIYLPSRMIEITDLLVKQHPVGSLFRDEHGNPLSKASLKKAIRNLCFRSSVTKRIPAYSWRHPFAIEYLSIPGASIKKLAELLNTSVHQIERTYGHLGENSQALSNEVRGFRG